MLLGLIEGTKMGRMGNTLRDEMNMGNDLSSDGPGGMLPEHCCLLRTAAFFLFFFFYTYKVL